MKDWKIVYASSQLATASIVESLLNEKGIPAKAMDKKDSAFVFLGKVEIFVPIDRYEEALEIIKTIELDTLQA